MTTEPAKKPSGFYLFAIVAWPFYLNDFYLIPLTRRPGFTNMLWMLDLFFYFFLPTLTLFLLYRQGHLAHVVQALKKPQKLYLHILGALALLLFTNEVFTHWLDPACIPNGFGRVCFGYAFPQGNYFLRLVTQIYAALSAGFLEEIVFRAHLMELLKRRFKSGVAVVIVSAALFAAIHWCGGTGKLFVTFLAGLLPAAIYWRTGNLWLPIMWHSLHDFFSLG